MAKRKPIICVHHAKSGKPLFVNLDDAKFDLYAKPVTVKMHGVRYEVKETAKVIRGFIKEVEV
jgi:hypothetical protein